MLHVSFLIKTGISHVLKKKNCKNSVDLYIFYCFFCKPFSFISNHLLSNFFFSPIYSLSSGQPVVIFMVKEHSDYTIVFNGSLNCFIIGRRRIYMISFFISVIGSICCALAVNVEMFIVFRAVGAIGSSSVKYYMFKKRFFFFFFFFY
jgi:MFS family permease